MNEGQPHQCPHPVRPGQAYCPICALELAETLPADARPEGREGGATLARVFGNYEIVAKIGEGGMGVVYKARQRGLSRFVALKLMRSGPWANRAEVKRFQQEAQAAAQLQHPNIVGVHDVGEQDGQLFFSMEYVEGKNLAQLIREAPLPPRRAAQLVESIAEAIHYAHERGVLHRDLKPANILLDASAKPRITDFGLARQIEIDSELTLAGTLLGTPSYMPPEQALSQRVTFRSDVYSLGAILYDCLTGRPPFRADTPLDTCRQVVETEPVSPRLLNPKVPVDLETICLKCLAKDPEQRFATAHEFAQDLGRFLKSEPIHARPIQPWVRLWRWGQRKPALAVMSVVVLILSGMLGLAAWLARTDAVERNMDSVLNASAALQREFELLGKSLEVRAQDPVLIALLEAVRLEPELRLGVECSPAVTTPAAKQHFQDLETYLRELTPAVATASSALTNMALLSPQGCLMARWPSVGPIDERDPDTSLRSGRDYYRGAMEGSGAVYVSRVYESADDAAYKFGIARAVCNAEGDVLAVLEAMVTTSPGSTPFAAASRFGHLILVGETDPNPKPGARATPRNWPKALIIRHPAFRGVGEEAFPVFDERLDFLFRSDPSAGESVSEYRYRDPVGDRDPKYRGRWLATKMRVPGTHFVAVYQTRDRVFDALWRTALIVVGVTVVVAGGWLFRSRRRKE